MGIARDFAMDGHPASGDESMTVEIKQSSWIKQGDKERQDLEGLDWWHWSVWLEAPRAELEKIEYVEYVLHPTFPQPVRRVTDRSTNFRFESAGWGEFMIYAKVHLHETKDPIELRHWLLLREPEAAQPSAKRAATPAAPGLFLSSSVADEPFADALQDALEKKGVKVFRATDDPNLPWQASLEGTLRQANGAVLIISNNQSPWLKRETEAVRHRKLPIVPIVIGRDTERLLKDANLEQSLAAIQRPEIKDVEASAKEIAEQLTKYQWQ
jgi:hypothetical protein